MQIMLEQMALGLEPMVAGLKAIAEPTRLRILMLLTHGDLTVKDLTAILSQSQPRISRHLKLLNEAGLIDRHPEGAWVYYRPADGGRAIGLVRTLIDLVDPGDPVVARDQERLDRVKQANALAAARYFGANADDWDQIRTLHIQEQAVEAEMCRMIGGRPIQTFLDLGTGTGRILELFSDLYVSGVGIDASQPMLSVARANLDAATVANTQVRHGDIFNLTVAPDSFDVITIHQVLHFLDDPGRAILEAARVLRAGGAMLIVDFLPHQLEFLRKDHAHRRLGFDQPQMSEWLEAAGLEIEQTSELVDTRKTGPALTVGLWLARDPRKLMAETASPETRA
jgi:ubiquinone/menaquinone biosynthesis C-methylase UbiE/DNA-binding transcriptional ArsR family regulator